MGIHVEGQQIPRWLFHVELQREIDEGIYDQGARQLLDFAVRELRSYRTDDLDLVGRQIIDCLVDGGTADELDRFIPGH